MLEHLVEHVTKKNIYISVGVLIAAWFIKEYILNALDERKIQALGGHAGVVKNRLPWGRSTS